MNTPTRWLDSSFPFPLEDRHQGPLTPECGRRAFASSCTVSVDTKGGRMEAAHYTHTFEDPGRLLLLQRMAIKRVSSEREGVPHYAHVPAGTGTTAFHGRHPGLPLARGAGEPGQRDPRHPPRTRRRPLHPPGRHGEVVRPQEG